jgi:hypothetical protein
MFINIYLIDISTMNHSPAPHSILHQSRHYILVVLHSEGADCVCAEHKASNYSNEEHNVHVVFKYLPFACWLQFRLCLRDPRLFCVVPLRSAPLLPLSGISRLYLYLCLKRKTKR